MRWPVVDIVGFGFSLEKIMCFVFLDVDLNDKNTWKEADSDLVTERL